MNDPRRDALIFIRNLAMKKTKVPNDTWSTVFHIAQDALDGNTRTLNELRVNVEDQD